jgi:alkanesulfonate monooxygenase SsuD/methylene tetrahydromethanopterin reductase-like flavin-dependent oxidoreductase (luciferase family)
MTRYGVHAGTEGASLEECLEFWRRVEALGYEWISVWDHFYSLMGGASDRGSFDAVVSQAALAMATTKPRIGVLVYSVGYRHPAVLANAISAIDHLSDGRAEVAMGAGWHESEYRAYGLPFEPPVVRLDKLEEGVQCLSGLLRDERFSFGGKHFRLEDASLGVRPLQERVPVWVGGMGEKRTLPLAARIADGWDAPLQPSAEEFAHKVNVLEQACEAIGRDPASLRRSAHVAVLRDEDQVKERFGDYEYDSAPGGVIWGSDDQVLEGLKAFEEAGADQILLAGNITWGTDQLERTAGLLGLV